MSLRLKIMALMCVLAGALLGLALTVDAWLVAPWVASLVPDPQAAQSEALLRGGSARRAALVWMTLIALLISLRVADRALGRPLKRLAAEVSRRRVSGPGWAATIPQRGDEIGVIAREFGQTYDELEALRGSAARAHDLEQQLQRMQGIDFAVRRLAVSARRLGLAVQAGDGHLDGRLQSLTDEVAALRAITRAAGAGAEGALSALSPESEHAPECPAAPDALTPDRPLEAEPC